MSWLKRFNDRLNSNGKGEAPASSNSCAAEVCGQPATAQEAYDAAVHGKLPKRINDTERLGYDAVNLPDHYKQFKIEPVRFTVENKLNFLQASIIKYVVRFPYKNGVEDLKKAARMLDMAIAFEEGDPDWWKLPGERASRKFYLV